MLWAKLDYIPYKYSCFHNSNIHSVFIIVIFINLSKTIVLYNILNFKVELTWDSIKEENTMPFCHNFGLTSTVYTTYNSALVCIQYFIPLCIISYTYLRMALVLRAEESNDNISTRAHGMSVRRNKRKVKYIKCKFKIIT